MNFDIEKKFGEIIVGIDEVGRGTLAGPVVAVAVYIKRSLWKNFLEKYPDIIKINDSKKISKKVREKLYKILIKIINFGIGAASVKEIEEKNILQASLIAMERAYSSLKIDADFVLVDGIYKPKIKAKVEAIKNGDNKSISIASASIIAKVVRDNLMKKLSYKYPNFFWHKNSGYGTKIHINKIKLLGITPHHRKSFKPIIKMIR
ncbi:MAG: Ribonuclease HII [Alphaproteobacteria bacterium MarineAlpha6_Bin6]|nr:ribonuclease HII [Pelagibacteraceae bacterium]PPR30888.1 MAG: Ribonuclease HII [Alphaproteobacteria bacterium MarineAlpha6_Bin6]PPR33531.1 MAG: Ribonuclease HII [Alphaproteobacteria bacterium MarineAlpha6_Bin5]|tara:strand:+ start:424 stop:1038 length:615 start_codon:yes stop_codon:yes gene_type:complete